MKNWCSQCYSCCFVGLEMDASNVGARSLAKMDAKLFVEEYGDRCLQ